MSNLLWQRTGRYITTKLGKDKYSIDKEVATYPFESFSIGIELVTNQNINMPMRKLKCIMKCQ